MYVGTVYEMYVGTVYEMYVGTVYEMYVGTVYEMYVGTVYEMSDLWDVQCTSLKWPIEDFVMKWNINL